MKILIVPSWFPSKLHIESGSFFRDRAHILKKQGMNIVVAAPIMHSFKDFFRFMFYKKTNLYYENGLPIYIHEFINVFPKIERLQFSWYKKHTISLFKSVLIKIGKPDVVFVNSSIWAGASLHKICKKLDIPLIISEHLKEFLYTNGFSIFNQNLIRNTYKSSHAIIATSSSLYNSIIKLCPNAKPKTSIIPNPIDEDLFIIKKEKNRIKCTNFICIALFRPEKCIDLLIQSFYELHKSNINVKLTIVGDGTLKSQFLKKIKKLNMCDYILLKGYLSQNLIVKELHKNDVLILSSNIETFGCVLIEAQSCGMPVISTSCGGPIDIISTKTGLLVKPNSTKELIKGIKKMILAFKKYTPKDIRNETILKFGKKRYFNSIQSLIKKIILQSNNKQ